MMTRRIAALAACWWQCAIAVNVRIIFTQIRDSNQSSELQLSELRLFAGNGAEIGVTNITNPAGRQGHAAQGPEKLVDGDVNTKWLDLDFIKDGVSRSELIVNGLSEEPRSMEFTAAKDSPNRDPVAWYVEARTVCGTWVQIGLEPSDGGLGVNLPGRSEVYPSAPFALAAPPVLSATDCKQLPQVSAAEYDSYAGKHWPPRNRISRRIDVMRDHQQFECVPLNPSASHPSRRP